MRNLALFTVFILFASELQAQSWTPAQYTQAKGLIADSALRPPRIDTTWRGGAKDSIGSIIYWPLTKSLWNKTDTGWVKVGTGSINLAPYMKYADTAAMLVPYIRKVDADARYPQLAGSYANPSWITSLPWSKITSIPTNVTNAISQVTLSLPSSIFDSGDPVTGPGSGTLFGTLKTQTGSAGAGSVWASPLGGGTGTPAFRLLAAADIGSGTFGIARGGTGLSSLGTAGQMLRVNSGATALEYFSPGTANSIATLDGNGKVPLSQINDALLGAVIYQGTYNAATNTPALPTAASGNKGWYYVVSTAGTQMSLTLNPGDWVISNGSAWGKVDNNNAVTSVFGRTGAVTAQSGDYTTSLVTEGTNQYFTNARARTALSAGSGISYNNSTGVITSTITQYTDALARAALSATAPLTYNSSTGAFGITQASGSTSGYLSSTDWTTFNNKAAGSGDPDYIQNTTTQQASSNFNISGIGRAQIFAATNGTTVGGVGHFTMNTGGNIRWAIGQSNTESGSNAGSDFDIWRYGDVVTGSPIGNPFHISRATGNVGIGTATPSGVLEVNGNILASGITRPVDNSALRVAGGTAAGNQGAHIALRGGSNVNSPGEMTFHTGTGTGDQPERMRIDAAGNVGIGKTPVVKLDVVGDIAASASVQAPFLQSASSTGSVIIYGGSTSNGGASIGLRGPTYSTTPGEMSFHAGTGAGVQPERMRITSGGLVGIGVSTPAFPMHVLGTINAQAPTGEDAQLRADVSGVSASSFRTFRTGGRTGIYNNSTEAISILTNGNVGIGKTTPATALDVNGAITAAGSISNGQFTADGLGGVSANSLIVSGNVRYSAGSPAAGKVWTSDNSGNGSWQNSTLTGAVLLSPGSAQTGNINITGSATFGTGLTTAALISTGGGELRSSAGTNAALTLNNTAVGAISMYTGNGDPSGVVSARKGSIYLRQDGGAGTTFYVKESDAAGSPSTSGWAAK